jgi:hypothetical protein
VHRCGSRSARRQRGRAGLVPRSTDSLHATGGVADFPQRRLRIAHSAIGIAALITRYFEQFHSSIGTFFFAAPRHETDSFCRLFLAPQQKAMGRF